MEIYVDNDDELPTLFLVMAKSNSLSHRRIAFYAVSRFPVGSGLSRVSQA